jgi:hypothetical protein
MKRLTILTMVFLFILSVVHGQPQTSGKESKSETKNEVKSEKKALNKLVGKDVSNLSKNNFYVDFGDLKNVKWDRFTYFDVATFTKNGKETKAYYDWDGKLVGTTQVVKFTDLPETAQKEIKNKYKDYVVGPVTFFNDNELNDTDMFLYGSQFEDEDNYFVELTKADKGLIVRCDSHGNVSYFTAFK